MKQRILIIGTLIAMPAAALVAMPSVDQSNNQLASPEINIITAAPTQPGPETVSASIEKIGVQGNWVKKREWLIQANQALADIQEIAVQAESLRKTFIDKYNAVDAQLDSYYQTLGTHQGKLQELFDSIFRYLEKKKAQEIAKTNTSTNGSSSLDTSALIDTIEESIKISKNQLEQLKLDMKSIEDLGNSLVERLNRLDEQLNTIQDDANRATSITSELWSIIDHNKARDRYYELKLNIFEKIKNVQTYLNNDLLEDFDAVIATIQAQITRTQESIKKLEDDGFFIKNRAERVKSEKTKQAELKQQEQKVLEALKNQQKEAQKNQQPKKKYTGPFAFVYNFFISLFAFFVSLFWGTPEQPKKPAARHNIPQMPTAAGAPKPAGSK